MKLKNMDKIVFADSILSFDDSSTGPTSLRSEFGDEKDPVSNHNFTKS
jgi:hypothetical protein